MKKILSIIFMGLLAFSFACEGGSDTATTTPPAGTASLTLNVSTLSVNAGSTADITATAKKADGTDDTITADSSNLSFTTVSVSGLVTTVTGVAAGSATITVTSGSGLTKTCAVTVNAAGTAVDDPAFNLTAGWYTGSQSLTITTTTPGATIYYTTDGTDPSSINGTQYTVPVVMNDTNDLKAIAIKSGMVDSNIANISIKIRRFIVYYLYNETGEEHHISVFDIKNNEDTSGSWGAIDFTGHGNMDLTGIKTDSNGNVYIIGYRDHDFVTNIANGFIRKFSSDGVEISTGWNKTLSNISNDGENPKGALDSNDNLYVIGNDNATSQCVVKKYAPDGSEDIVNWGTPFGTNYSGQNIAVNHNNSDQVFAVGLIANGASGMFIKAFNSDGSAIAAWGIERASETGYTSSGARGVAFDSSNNVYIGGFQGDIGGRYFWITKYNNSDQSEAAGWNKTYPAIDDSVETIILDSAGDVYANGMKKFSPDGTEDAGWDKSGGRSFYHSNNIYIMDKITGGDGKKDYKIMKYNLDGTEVTIDWNLIVDGGSNLSNSESGFGIFQ